MDAEPGRRDEGAHAGDADAEVAGERQLDAAAVDAAVERRRRSAAGKASSASQSRVSGLSVQSAPPTSPSAAPAQKLRPRPVRTRARRSSRARPVVEEREELGDRRLVEGVVRLGAVEGDARDGPSRRASIMPRTPRRPGRGRSGAPSRGRGGRCGCRPSARRGRGWPRRGRGGGPCRRRPSRGRGRTTRNRAGRRGAWARVTSTQPPAPCAAVKASTSTGVWETTLSSRLWFQTSSSRGATLRSPTRMARSGGVAANQARSSARKSSLWANFGLSAGSGRSPPAGM